MSPLGLDDFDLFPAPASPRAGAAGPRKHRHHWTTIRHEVTGEPVTVCYGMLGCGAERDPITSRRGRLNRSRGNADELTVAKLLGGRKVGPLGLPHDVELTGYMRLQCKKVASWPSLAKVLTWIDAMQPGGDVRGVTVADTPGPGGRTRRLLIVDLDEYARWHGKGE